MTLNSSGKFLGNFPAIPSRYLSACGRWLVSYHLIRSAVDPEPTGGVRFSPMTESQVRPRTHIVYLVWQALPLQVVETRPRTHRHHRSNRHLA